MSTTDSAIARGRSFIDENARPMERARAAVLFDGASSEAVWQALKAFTNQDGGFGHGLEPDLMGSASTVLATRIALETFQECNIDPDHPLLIGTLDYLKNTYNTERKAWPISNSAATDGPHAPWWNPEEGQTEIFWEDNPTPEIIGYLLAYRDLAGQTWIHDVIHAFGLDEDVVPIDANMHALCSWFVLLRSPELTDVTRTRLIKAIQPLVTQTLAIEPEKWNGYCLRPLQVASHPNDPLRSLVPDNAIQNNLEFILSEQSDDGAWYPTWNWGNDSPEDWPKARTAWGSYLTLHHLKALKVWSVS